MVLRAEAVWHAALAVDAAAEGDRFQIAAQVIAPGVVDAGEVFRVAGVVEADQCTPVQATVFERGDGVGFGPHHHDGHAADEGGAPVTGVRDVGFNAEVVPHRTFKQALLFLVEQRWVLVDLERDLGEAFRPVACGRGDG